MEKKEIKFDLSADALFDLADARLEEGDHLAALRMLYKSVELYGPAADELAEMADVYDEMELFEQSAECWFRYLDVCEEEEAVDAYEGLAACYFNLGNDRMASYYYKKMLSDKYITPSNNVEMGELLERPRHTPFRISWPPESADYSQEIDAGLKALKSGDFEKAESQFLRVHERSEYYPSALNYLSVTYLLAGKTAEAEATCRKLLEREPENIQTLATYAAVLTEQDRREESRAIAERIASLKSDSADELYKAATVCCENGLYEQAYERFCRLENMVSYDRTLLYFKAVSAFRCGRKNESLQALGKILDFQPRAAVVRYYYRAIRKYVEEGGEEPETTFFCHIPSAEREKRIELLKLLASMRTSEARAYFEEKRDAEELLEWCFDESDGRETELQTLAVSVAVRAGRDGFLCDALLNPAVNDLIKIEAVHQICRKNRSVDFSIVIADIFRKMSFDRLEVGKARRAKFIDAYVLCYTRFVLLGEGSASDFRFAAQAIYDALESADKLNLVNDAESLACAIFLTVVTTDGKQAQYVLKSMNANPEEVSGILSVLHEAFVAGKEVAATDGNESEEGGEKDEVDRF